MKSSHIQVSSSPVILGAGLPISDVITAFKAAAEAAPEEYGLVPTSVKMLMVERLFFLQVLPAACSPHGAGWQSWHSRCWHHWRQLDAKTPGECYSYPLVSFVRRSNTNAAYSSILTFRRTWSPCSRPWRPPWRWCGRRRTARRGCPTT